MKITCEVVRDLLPLVHDGVASGDSRKLVEEHIRGCSACRAAWEQMDSEEPNKDRNREEAAMLQKTASIWKKNKAAAFFAGALIVSLAGCVGCGAAYNLIGSYVTADGLLVEPFYLIPLTWLFALLAAIFGIGLAAARGFGCRACRRFPAPKKGG